MNKEQFTPGPWHLSTKRDRTIVDAEGKAICKTFVKPRFSNNANLIAAAPDMYEALKKVNDLLDDYFQSKDELVPAEIVEAYEIIEAALNKANGK